MRPQGCPRGGVPGATVPQRSDPNSWWPLKVCVCDATVEEMDMVFRINEENEAVRYWDWEVRRAKIRRDAERAEKAADTRRANWLKRKREAGE